MSAKIGPFVRVARRNQIAPDRALVVRVGRDDVAIFDVGGELFAYENVCPHQGGPIGEGEIEGGTVTCPWHAWCFDLRSGKLTLGDFAELRAFDVRVEGDDVLVAPRSEP
jgi:nitrite reductase (NADH) small subunit